MEKHKYTGKTKEEAIKKAQEELQELEENLFIKEIAETKMPDLNAYNVEEAMKIVAGTAKNMGIEIVE